MRKDIFPIKKSKKGEEENDLLNEIRGIILETRRRVARNVNSELVLMYWMIGKRISEEILKKERAEYGKKICATLSHKLTMEYGKGYSKQNLFRMIRFSEMITKKSIVSTLSRKLSWSHFVEIMNVRDPLAQDFYIQLCKIENWPVRTLRDRIRSMLFERTVISKKPESLIKMELKKLRENKGITPDLVFRNPYFLNFLGLKNRYTEHDLESAILSELESFLIELGTDFSFLARQKRMTIGKDDFYLDLLFYHRTLKRLIAIELKLGKFKPSHKGQMELYLRWLDKYERKEGEEEPIGLILCSEKDKEQIQLLQLEEGEIRVAEYLTQLPPLPLLEEKLRNSILIAREQLEARKHQEETNYD
jgi:predicted nuclease of restriction endonuclease-like (RecB) superfamily